MCSYQLWTGDHVIVNWFGIRFWFYVLTFDFKKMFPALLADDQTIHEFSNIFSTKKNNWRVMFCVFASPPFLLKIIIGGIFVVTFKNFKNIHVFLELDGKKNNWFFWLEFGASSVIGTSLSFDKRLEFWIWISIFSIFSKFWFFNFSLASRSRHVKKKSKQNSQLSLT